MTRVGALLFAAALCAACGSSETATSPEVDAATYTWPEGPHPTAVLEIHGLAREPDAGPAEIEVELYPELAPSTVKNFRRLVENDFYAGTTFHRVIEGFMIQGGDPNSKDADPSNDGLGDAGWKIQDEFSDAPHVRGVLAMANIGQANSASCQFFILHEDARHLDGKYTIFGRVTRGMDVVDAIAAVEVDEFGRWGPPHRPLSNVTISHVAIEAPAAPARSVAQAPAS